ncbi:hypothetical protein O3G_MSEX013280 [Manduca sexta]|uniref:Anaphase-promoting complex subunit 1 middle domain-containing protein n=1 Tax=Manduca sexta TaxID=7130 RepID=A0A921ZRF9_MANSE|nr:hypothetical protein O3G_MSEX013280 [Manduca sexta]
MIAASEPLEFIPHGRTVLEKHPGQVYGRGHNSSVSENSLLYKLTNFAIKDESLLEAREEEEEWWCIREVYYRSFEDVEDEEPQNKSSKYDYNSESFRPPSLSTVLAKDAVVLDHLKMIALIDESGNIILQSGNCVVGKVHVCGVLARLLSPAPFPRRSSVLPAHDHAARAALDDSALHLLSPVPSLAHDRMRHKDAVVPSGLTGLLDAAGSRLTLQFDSNLMYRISLPALSRSTLVTRCHTALTAILPKDVTMQVIIKWYGVRNAPGTQDLTPEQEWSMFTNLLFSLIGYDVERLHSTNNDDQGEVEVVSKKQRTSSDGTSDDWEYLLNSKLHKAIGNSLANILNLPTVNIDNKHRYIEKNIDTDKPAQFNTNALLFPYILHVLFSFHLVYEEIKLNTLLFDDLKPLSIFLYQLSKDLKLESYVNHYWLDFPTEFCLDYDDYESQMTDGVLEKLSEPTCCRWWAWARARACGACAAAPGTLAQESMEKETPYTLIENPREEASQSKAEDDTSTGMEILNTKLLRLLYPRDHR